MVLEYRHILVQLYVYYYSEVTCKIELLQNCVSFYDKKNCTHKHLFICSQRKCFRTFVEGDPCNPTNCSSSVIPRTNFSINLQPIESSTALQTKFWSPGKIRNPPRNYQNNRHCQYHLVCPPGQLLLFGFRTGNFDLEPDATGFCLDYVFIEDFSRGNFILCGSQTQTVWMRAAPLRVEFRSNTGGRYPGFQIDAICARPELANMPDCTTPSSSTGVPVPGRRRRALTAVSECHNNNV